MGLSEKELRERAEYRRLVDEEFERKRKTGFKNGEEALKAFRDLFESDEEMDEYVGGALRLLDLVDYPLYMVALNALPPVPALAGRAGGAPSQPPSRPHDRRARD